MLTVTFYTPDDEGDPKLFGTLTWSGKRFNYEGKPFPELLGEQIMGPNGKLLTAREQPELFMQSLRAHYRGGYFWASPPVES